MPSETRIFLAVVEALGYVGVEYAKPVAAPELTWSILPSPVATGHRVLTVENT
jgi:hypothetical protein